MTQSTDDTTTAPQQIAAMQRLSQQSAAWLLECSPRTLRDHPEIPRAADGSYDARELVRHARGAARLPDLDDDRLEAALRIAEGIDADALAVVRNALETLVATIGGDKVAALCAVSLVIWRHHFDAFGRFPTQFEFGPDRMHRAMRCMVCGKVRRGRAWVDGPLPAGDIEVGAYCPEHLHGVLQRASRDELADELETDFTPTRRRKSARR
jgi:hypothetical protein